MIVLQIAGGIFLGGVALFVAAIVFAVLLKILEAHL